MSIRVSAPGSMMLMGEHAVLHGQAALVAALNRRIKVSLRTRADNTIEIISKLGTISMPLQSLSLTAPFEYALAPFMVLQEQLDQGFTILIDSEFEGAVGLGSSTAVVVAVTAAILRSLDSNDNKTLFDYALKAVRLAQGRGSGADVAASVYGGAVFYQPLSNTITPMRYDQPVALIYSGKKTKTRDVIAYVEQRFEHKNQQLQAIYQNIGTQVHQAANALQQQHYRDFFQAIQANQAAMVELGVCDKKLHEIINYVTEKTDCDGVKISGSGLGDCVIVFGHCPRQHFPYPVIDIAIEAKGVVYS